MPTAGSYGRPRPPVSRNALLAGWRRRLLLAGDCESGDRDGERGAAAQSAHAVPCKAPGEEGPGGAHAPRPTRASLSAGGDARTSRETGCAPTEAGAAAERATETRSRPLVTTVRWSRGTACESRLRVREVRAPAGEDVARVADVAGVERLVAPGGRGSARCSSARRTRAMRGSDCGSGASGAGRSPRRRPRLRGSRTAATSRPLYFAATALSPLRVSSGSSAPSTARALSGHGGRVHSQVSARLPRTYGTPGNRSGTPRRPLVHGADRDPFLDRLLADVLVARIAVEFAPAEVLEPGRVDVVGDDLGRSSFRVSRTPASSSSPFRYGSTLQLARTPMRLPSRSDGRR
jgi:hypothetical protein